MPVDSTTTEAGYLDHLNEKAVSADANQTDASSGADDTTTDANKAKPQSLMDAVTERLKQDGLGEESSPPKKEADSEATKADDAAAKDAVADDADAEGDEKDPPFHKHPAWQKQLARRAELEGQLQDMAPKAERFEAMQAMMRESNLEQEEVNAGFNIMALMKGDPAKALESLTPYWNSLQLATGNALPDDLNERVEAGYLTEEDAREVARARMAGNQAKVSVEKMAKDTQERDENALRNDMAAGVTDWDNALQARDPDYAIKLPFILTEIKALRAETPPRSRGDAIALADKALANVNASMKALQPRKPAIKDPVSGSSVTATSAPKNSLEAAKAALANIAA
jgi:hypothetical protein